MICGFPFRQNVRPCIGEEYLKAQKIFGGEKSYPKQEIGYRQYTAKRGGKLTA